MRRSAGPLVSTLLLLLVLIPPAEAFRQWDGEDSGMELRGFIRFAGAHSENPDYPPLFPDRSSQSALAIARLLGNGWIGDSAGLELNAYQSYLTTTSSREASGISAVDVERSGYLEWTVKDEPKEQALFAIDRFNVRFSLDRFDLTVGRQAINLATTFYFTPNDFFAPFGATTFYRVYKPGVDAARLEVRLGELSQLSFFEVLGYDPDSSEPSGWSGSPSPGRSSHLARASANLMGFELALLGGRVARKAVAGASLQGELFGWLGLRAEGHHADPDSAERDAYGELTVGVEHRFESSLELRLEWFHHGAGAASARDYGVIPTPGETAELYLGRQYIAFNIGYEFSPLLTAQFLPVSNLADGSYLLAFYSVYSLSDESELSFSFTVPSGRKPDGGGIRSEFGLYPVSASLELRTYF
jgi:hypothetical protein